MFSSFVQILDTIHLLYIIKMNLNVFIGWKLKWMGWIILFEFEINDVFFYWRFSEHIYCHWLMLHLINQAHGKVLCLLKKKIIGFYCLRAALGSQQNWAEGAEISYLWITSALHPHPPASSVTITISHRDLHLLQLMNYIDTSLSLKVPSTH